MGWKLSIWMLLTWDSAYKVVLKCYNRQIKIVYSKRDNLYWFEMEFSIKFYSFYRHLEFLKMLNDVSLASFGLFNNNNTFPNIIAHQY